ncbi:MAG: hypothetical protein WBL65_06430 [Bryobacteraceae bacterium]
MTAATVEAPAHYQFKPEPYSSHALSNILAVALLFCRGLHAATPAGYRQRVGIYVWGEIGGRNRRWRRILDGARDRGV